MHMLGFLSELKKLRGYKKKQYFKQYNTFSSNPYMEAQLHPFHSFKQWLQTLSSYLYLEALQVRFSNFTHFHPRNKEEILPCAEIYRQIEAPHRTKKDARIFILSKIHQLFQNSESVTLMEPVSVILEVPGPPWQASGICPVDGEQ